MADEGLVGAVGVVAVSGHWRSHEVARAVQVRTHKRIIDISEPRARTVEAINRIQFRQQMAKLEHETNIATAIALSASRWRLRRRGSLLRTAQANHVSVIAAGGWRPSRRIGRQRVFRELARRMKPGMLGRKTGLTASR